MSDTLKKSLFFIWNVQEAYVSPSGLLETVRPWKGLEIWETSGISLRLFGYGRDNEDVMFLYSMQYLQWSNCKRAKFFLWLKLFLVAKNEKNRFSLCIQLVRFCLFL